MNKTWEILDQYRDEHIKGEWPTIPEMFKITTLRYPNNRAFTAFTPYELSLTYKESLQVIENVSKYLVSIGLKKGDKIAVYGKNSPEWAIAYLATTFLGGIVVPIDYGLSVEEVIILLEKSESKIIFSEKDRYHSIKDGSNSIDSCFSLNKNFENYILDLETGDEITLDSPLEEDTAAILYTSGTTGVSKGVMLSHKNFSSDVWLAQGNLNIYNSDVFYALLPIHHSYTMTSVFLEAIFIGAEIVFGKQLVFSQILKDFKQGKVTMFLGVPMLFNKIIHGLLSGVRKKGIILYGIIKFLMSISGFIKKTFKVNPGKKMFGFILKKASLENIRICISGGGPLAPSTFKHFNQLGIDFVQGYGLTECSPMLALNPVEKYKEDSVGKVLHNVDIKIVNKDSDGIGDIIAKGPNVMQGYYKQKAETKAVFTKDGYLITGDAGYLDSDNYLYLTGRKASLIVTEGGKNVYPEELEDCFQLYDGFEQILIKSYIKNKETLSEGIEVVFYPTEDILKNTSREGIKSKFLDITSEVNKTLTSYKHIDKVTVIKKAMPMTTTKKIKRNEVFKIYNSLEQL